MNRIVGFSRRLHFFDDLLQAVFEFALHARAGLQCADVEREQPNVAQWRRHVARGDSQREAFDDGRFADAGFAGENRIVLPPPHEDIDNLPDFLVAADDRIDLALAGLLGEVGRELLQRFFAAHRGRLHRAAGFARHRRLRPRVLPSAAANCSSTEPPTILSKFARQVVDA